MKLQAYINSITLNNKLTIPLERDSITVILGPNNSGKTTVLRDIEGHVFNASYVPTVVSNIDITRETPLEDVITSLERFKAGENNYNAPNYSFSGQSIDEWWKPTKPFLGYLAPYSLIYLRTRQRLTDCDPVPPFDARQEKPDIHPIQFIYRYDELETAVSKVFRRAFKKDLIVHRAAGNLNIPLYVGERPTLNEGENPTQFSYVERLEKLDRLEEQGDGMVSFASLALRVIAGRRPIILIDEPEAFLHPPQARLVAETITNAEPASQVFIATHSSEILQGLLKSNSDRICFVRLSRIDEVASVNYLDNADIKQLWSDPILKYSNVVEGLFHEAVILAEADGDCRFFDTIEKSTRGKDDQTDFFYTHSGGKHRLPVLVKALKALNVPVRTIVDFDVLNDETPLKPIIEAHGGLWADFEKDWKAIKTGVEAQKTYLNGQRFKREVDDNLSGISEDKAVPQSVVKAVRAACTATSPWATAKSQGLNAFKGEAHQKVKGLLSQLRGIGIFVIPNGEMEGFCRSEGGHGVNWVAEVLKKDIKADTELEAARVFVGDLRASLI